MKFNGQQLKLSKKHLIKSRTIVKAAILEYIQSWFIEGSSNHVLLKTIVSGNLNYQIKEWTIQNQIKRNVAILNYFEGIKQQLPSILIIDTGIIPKADIQGFQPQSAIWEDNRKKIVIRRVLNIGVSIVIGTMDSATTNNIVDLLLLFFDSLRQIAGGNSLVSDEPEEPWEVRLPLANITTSPLTDSNVDNANVSKIWATTIDLPDTYFETCFKVELDGTFPSIGVSKILPEQVNIVFSDSIVNLGINYPLSYTPYVPNMKFWVNSREASILYKDNFYWLKPIKLGNIEIKLVNMTELSNTKTYKVIDTISLQVV